MKRILTALACSCAFAMACNAQMTAARMMAFGGAALPYDREVEYLESSGTQYIDTGVKASSLDRWELEFGTVVVNTGAAFWGAQNDGGDRLSSAWITSTGGIRYGGGFQYVFSTWRGLRAKNAIVISSGAITLNGQTVTGPPFIDTYSTQNIYLFACNNITSVGCICWGMKRYVNNILTIDYIPVIDRAGVACMYDRVSKKLFYNAGTGSFSYAEK